MTMNDETEHYYLGIDIGGTKCAVVLGDRSFRIHRRIQFDTLPNERSYSEIIRDLFQHCDDMLDSIPNGRLNKIGISCGGPLDSGKGVILSPPNLPGWDNVPVVQMFREKYGVDTFVQNDANACALAEWLMGAGNGSRNMIFLTFGTGMGAGLILNGQLYTGTNDLGGEAGHIRLADDGPVGFGKAGSFEGFCSGGGIAQLAKSVVVEKLRKDIRVAFCPSEKMAENLSAKDVATAALGGDETAKEIIKLSAAFLGKGLAILIDILNPECIVIGSIYARNENLFKPHMEQILKKETIPAALDVCTIKPAALGDSIGDYAALCVAVYENGQNLKS